MPKIKGDKELDAMLAALPQKLANNVMRGAMRAGAQVIATEARRLVPHDTGQLRDSIQVGSARVNTDGTISIRVVAKGPGSFVAPWVEFGTGMHLIAAKKKPRLWINGRPVGTEVTHPGARPRPFMRPAFDGKRAEAIDAIGAYVAQRLASGNLNTPDTTPQGEE